VDARFVEEGLLIIQELHGGRVREEGLQVGLLEL
jgi:hypothetical protein